MSNLTKEVTNYYNQLCDVYETEYFPKESLFGLYLNGYLYSQGLIQRNFSQEEFQGISQIQLKSLEEFGFTINNSKRFELEANTKEVFFIEFNSKDNDYFKSVAAEINNIISNKANVNQMHKNYIIFYDNGVDDGINCSISFVNLLKTFKEKKTELRNFSFLEYDLTTDYLQNEHMYKICTMTYENIDTLVLDIQKIISSGVVPTKKDCYVSEKIKENISDFDVFCLAYYGLKNKLNIVFKDNKLGVDYLQYCKILFEGRYKCLNDFLKFQLQLNNSCAIISNNRITRGCVLGSIPQYYTVKAIPIAKVLNSEDVSTLKVLLKPEELTIDIKQTYPTAKFLEVFGNTYYTILLKDKNTTDNLGAVFSSLMSRLQQVAMGILTTELISIKEIIFFKENNQQYFGCIQQSELYFTQRKISVETDNGLVLTDKINLNEILPTQLYKEVFENATTYEFDTLALDELQALYDGMSDTTDKFIYYMGEEKISCALYSQNITHTEEDKRFYDSLKAIDPILTKNIVPNLTGTIAKSLRVSP